MGHRCRAGARGDRCEPSPGSPRRAERFRTDALGEHLLGDLLVSGKHHLNAPDVIDHLREVVRRGEVDVLGAFQRLRGRGRGPSRTLPSDVLAPPRAAACKGMRRALECRCPWSSRRDRARRPAARRALVASGQLGTRRCQRAGALPARGQTLALGSGVRRDDPARDVRHLRAAPPPRSVVGLRPGLTTDERARSKQLERRTSSCVARTPLAAGVAAAARRDWSFSVRRCYRSTKPARSALLMIPA